MAKLGNTSWQHILAAALTCGHMQVASEAAMRAPEEVYKAQQQGAPKAADELSREERTRIRAKKKRAGKKQKLQQVHLVFAQVLSAQDSRLCHCSSTGPSSCDERTTLALSTACCCAQAMNKGYDAQQLAGGF